MKLTMIRHGITEGNKRVLIYGSTDIPLLPEGKVALEQLRNENKYPSAPRYYTSGKIRTEETFSILYGNLPHDRIPELSEFNFGRWEMKSFEEMSDNSEFQEWLKAGDDAHCPDGESHNSMVERITNAIQPIIDSDTDSVCVIHGGVIANLLRKWFPLQAENRYSFTPPPGTGYQVIIENGVPVSYIPIPFAKESL